MTYLQPEKLEDALSWLASRQPLVMAGCTDIYPLHSSPALTGPLLDITRINELRGIEKQSGWRRIGAATSWGDILTADLPASYDALKQAAREIGSVQIQTSATIGGNLCTASPAADSVPCLLALDAEVELASANQRRRLPLAEFLTGPRQTALAKDELLVAIWVAEAAEEGHSAFVKLGARRYLVISIAMVAARLAVADGQITAAAISVGSCAPIAVRLAQLEAALLGRKPLAAARIVAEHKASITASLAPIDDVRASADYRLEAAAEMVARAVEQACQEAVA
jgi:CO/xanthine dehydrogenase FAD-binding subunit